MTKRIDTGAPQTMSEFKRQVVVVTGFGGEEHLSERRAILHVTRLKYLIEHMIKVPPQGGPSDHNLKYEVSVLKAPVGHIPDDALTAIDSADVLVALITEQNINVIYEIAIRNLLHDETVILLSPKAGKVLPIYLQSMARIDYEKSDPPPNEKTIFDVINALANSPDTKLGWRTLHIVPEELLPLIRKSDDRLVDELQAALQEMEDGPPPRPVFLRNLVKNLDPGRLLSSWTTYVPFSVLRINWKQRSEENAYTENDMIGKPVVYSANFDYLRFFDIGGELPDPNGTNPMTFKRLMDQVEPFVRADHMKAFVEDQARATQRIIFENGFASTKVPIHFNERHPHYAHGVYLPQLIAKRIVGDTPHSPHVMFVFVAMIEDFFPLQDTDNQEKMDGQQNIR